MYIPGKTIVIGDAADIATYIHASYAHVNTGMGYGAKGNLLRDLHRLHPDIDTVLFTSHRDGSNAALRARRDLGHVEAVLVPGAPAAAAQRRAVHVQDPAGDQVPRLQGVHPRVDELAQVRLLSLSDHPLT